MEHELTTPAPEMITPERITDGQADRQENKEEKLTISRQVLRTLLAAVLAAFALALALIYTVFTWRAIQDAKQVLNASTVNSAAVIEMVRDWQTDKPQALAEKISSFLSSSPSQEEMARVAQILNESNSLYTGGPKADEISVADSGGVVIASTVPDMVGVDLNAAPESRAFFRNLKMNGHYVAEEFSPGPADPAVPVLCFGASEGDVYVYYRVTWDAYTKNMAWSLHNSLDGQYIGENGIMIISDRDGNIIACTEGRYTDTVMDESIFPFDISAVEPLTMFRAPVEGVDCYVMTAWTRQGEYCVVGTYWVSEAFENRNATVLTVILLITVILSGLFVLLLLMMNRTVVDGITRIAGSLARITDGDLEEKVDVRSAAEFDSLSDDINSTVDTLKRLIAEAAARIDAELAYAKQIQLATLPSRFPAFPQCPQFDIYARMDTAKEVGGDFYDFYLLDGDRLAFLIADVSGKGIPAALFMMTAKTMIKNLAEENHPVNEILTLANRRLCESNEAGMFVTVWMCILNYKTGEAEYANAGHNLPVLRRKDGTFAFLKSRPGFVLAGLEMVKYRKNTITFAPGDEIYLYTDGVTEATDATDAMFGDDRLISSMNSVSYTDARGLCDRIKDSVDAFVGDAPQFDDITMVGLRFLGQAEAPNDEPDAGAD